MKLLNSNSLISILMEVRREVRLARAAGSIAGNPRPDRRAEARWARRQERRTAMGFSMKVRLVAAITVLMCAALAAAWAEGQELLVISGEVVATARSESAIVVGPFDSDDDLVMIEGFPFGNLEAQLTQVLGPLDPDAEGVVIEKGDCVTLVYYLKESVRYDRIVSKFDSLTLYSENCGDCDEQPCYEDSIGLTRQPQRVRR
jgi:hypothetical protein